MADDFLDIAQRLVEGSQTKPTCVEPSAAFITHCFTQSRKAMLTLW